MIEAFNRRDFDTALERFSEDATWAPFLARTETPLLRGKQEIRDAWARQLEVMDLQGAAEVVFDDGPWVVTRSRMTGRGHGSEVAIDAGIAHVAEFDGDVIVSVETYDDVDAALRRAARGAAGE